MHVLNRIMAGVVAGLCLGVAAHGAPEPANPSDRFLQQELKQQQIKNSTQRVAGQLGAIIAEFERNAIDGEDVKVLRAINSVLGRLTEQDMERVINLLQQARGATDPNAVTRPATDAYTMQRSIISQLHQLVLEYQRQQALYELSLRFKEYAQRQTANMWQGVTLARETESRPLSSFSEAQQSSLRVQQIDQENLKEEVQITLNKLEQLSRDIAEGPVAERPRMALEQAEQGGLKNALSSAIDDLGNGKMMSATGNEKRARDQMREIARLLLLAQGDLAALRQALQEVEKVIEQQKAVTEDTRQVEKDDPAKVKSRQAEVVDATDLVRRDVASLAPAAAEQLRSAGDNMQEARSVLNNERDPKKQREKAPPKQEAALAGLEQARQMLQNQIARAEQFEQQPENALEALREIQEQVRQAMREEEELKNATAEQKDKELTEQAPRQGELKDKVQDLQQKAAKPSPSAAQSMGEATRQMQKAQASLASGKNNPEAQQAAMDALQQADQQLSQDIAQLEEAQQELAKLEEMQRKLAGIIEEQQKVQFSTAKQASQATPAAAPELSQRQEKLGAETGQLQTETATPAPAAAAHLGKAQEHMGQAQSELNKPAPKTALPKQTEALTDLYAAQHEMDNRMNELREQLGLGKQDNAQSLADAAARIEQAQRAVDQALTELQQAPPGLVDALTQQQQHIADTLGDMSKDGGAPEGVSQAQQAAAKAAQELGQSNLRDALAAMKAAESALKPNTGQPAPADQNNGKPNLPQVSAQQEEVRKATEQLLGTLQAASESAMQEAESALENAGQAISPLSSGQMGPLPRSVRGALQNAQENLAGGAAQAAARQGVPAQSEALQASQSLAQAAAALALAQAGLGSESMMAQGNSPSAPSQNQGQAQGQQAQAGAQGSGKGNATPQGTGRKGNWDARGGAEGPRNSRYGPGQYTRLPARDRAAILQSQSEKYPQEYGPLVEQYLKNLSDESATEP